MRWTTLLRSTHKSCESCQHRSAVDCGLGGDPLAFRLLQPRVLRQRTCKPSVQSLSPSRVLALRPPSEQLGGTPQQRGPELQGVGCSAGVRHSDLCGKVLPPQVCSHATSSGRSAHGRADQRLGEQAAPQPSAVDPEQLLNNGHYGGEEALGHNFGDTAAVRAGRCARRGAGKKAANHQASARGSKQRGHRPHAARCVPVVERLHVAAAAVVGWNAKADGCRPRQPGREPGRVCGGAARGLLGQNTRCRCFLSVVRKAARNGREYGPCLDGPDCHHRPWGWPGSSRGAPQPAHDEPGDLQGCAGGYGQRCFAKLHSGSSVMPLGVAGTGCPSRSCQAQLERCCAGLEGDPACKPRNVAAGEQHCCGRDRHQPKARLANAQSAIDLVQRLSPTLAQQAAWAGGHRGLGAPAAVNVSPRGLGVRTSA
mmetsp:Transcript_12963/g.49598  ORF Transcript_12963/g.49598 Transcript_12963/m.49598 type:complete len:425 (-) Transcript_12963:699-1973(-)